VYPTAAFYDGSIQKPVLDIFLLTLLLLALGRALAGSWPARWLPVGAALGLLMLTRENALVFAFLVAAWLMLPVGGAPWRERLVAVALFAVGLSVVLLPVALRNSVVGGEFRLTAAQFGPTLYMGNHAGADGTYIPLRWGRGSAAFEAVDARELAEAATGRRLRSGEVSAYWTARALAYVRSAPGEWLRLMLRKWLLVWNVTEIGDTIDEYTYAEWSALLRGLQHVVHFGIVAPLAAFGIALLWPDRRRHGLLLLMVALYAASVAVFIIMSRYRLPLVPILLLFVAAGLLRGVARLSRDGRAGGRTLVLPALVGLAAAVVVNWPLVPAHAVRATTHTNIGIYLAKDARAPERAITHFERALALNPGYVEAHGNLGAVLATRGETDRGLAHLGDALRLKPDYVDGHYNVGLILGRSGKTGEAIAHLAEVARLAPDHADAHHALGFYLAASGDLPGAKAQYRETLRLVPDHADAHLRLGMLLLQEGRPSEAQGHLEAVVRSHPDSALALYHLGLALLQGGQPEPAAARFRAALRGTDADGPVHAKLGESLARLGRCSEAAPHFKEAVRWQPTWAAALAALRREWGCAGGG
jgi:tetratricopeptide (TPR) repeat protein